MLRTILIVDDFIDYTDALSSALKSKGYAVLVANGGQSAIQMAKTHKPDLILLDIMMPNIGGTEVRAELMQDTETQKIPIIFLTGLRQPHHKARPRGTSIRTIGKSDDLNELLQAIEETFTSK